MKYVSCDLIEHGLDFFTDSINFCCRTVPTENGYKKIIANYHGEKIDWDNFFAIKRSYREQMKKGEIIPECKGCIYLQEKDWDDEDYVSFINFNNWLICNEHCVYCFLNDNKQDKNSQYNIYPAIKDMIDRKYLRSGGHITIAGAEPTVAPEFEDLLNLFLDSGMYNIRILTNATKYSKAIEKGLKSGAVNIAVSVDSGTKDTFKKIKRFDFYNKVWDNIKHYAKVQKLDDAVKTKFIIIPDVNDNEKEITEWLKKSKSSGVKHVSYDVEMFWYDKNKNNIPDKLFYLLQFIDYTANKLNLQTFPIDRASILISQMH